MSSFTGTWLSSDQKFKVAGNVGMWQNGKWIRQYDSSFSVMNEDGIVLGWQLTRGTGFSRVKTIITGIHKRLKNSGVKRKDFGLTTVASEGFYYKACLGFFQSNSTYFMPCNELPAK